LSGVLFSPEPFWNLTFSSILFGCSNRPKIVRYFSNLYRNGQIQTNFNYWVILWAIWKTWTRVHGNPWNLAIWFIIRYNETRIFLFWPKKFFLLFLRNFEKFWPCANKIVKSRYSSILNRFSRLSTFFEGNLVIFWLLLAHILIFPKTKCFYQRFK
jgi:hypothetical protein